MIRVILCVAICLIMIPFPLSAQDTTAWDSACSKAAQPVIAPVMGQDLYKVGCEAGNRCFEDNEMAPIGCEYDVYDALMALCEGDDCVLHSRFYTASLLMFENPPLSVYSYTPRELQVVFPQTLVDFQAGDYQAVAETYESVSAQLEFEFNKSPFHEFIVGLMYEELGDLDAASEAYRRSIELLRSPLVTDQRAQVLLQLGYEDVAAAEALAIGDDPAAVAILAQNPLPDESLEDWMVYESQRKYGGEYGPAIYDFTSAPGRPIQAAFLSDGSVLIIGASDMLMPFIRDGFLPNALLFYPDREDYIWKGHWMGSDTRLTFANDVGSTATTVVGWMVDSHSNALIAPAEAPDPRGEQTQRCENGALWRLAVDEYGAASQIYGEGTPYYDALGGEVVGTFNPEMQIFRVVSGPLCLGSQTWWEVDLLQDDGQTYFLPEAEAQSLEDPTGLYYLVYPTYPPSK